ncbi:methyltransferase [Aurantiacibacter rhizosphaerae]|uniref:Methyltransferase domain-containing protein n=1 Tax=Aurantiacibacter rhizosphaerae TaxID=2691582 RepID=A0A844XER3_9SPHN|nr:methyltransferase [Aurantiacibacter rhizosphaerae]MWV28239.1 methyltransferase domain-containing protein [Aurantiacibacter rhizosphaerae]
MGPLPPGTDDRPIWDIWQSQFTLPAVTVADELGLFGAIGNRAMTTSELAQSLAVNERALGILLGALASIGVAERRDMRWSATPPARMWLHPEAEGYWGGFLLRFRQTIPLHADLIAMVRTGIRPENKVAGGPEWERGTMSAEVARRISDFMHAHSMGPARGAALQPVFKDVKSLLDVGCGSGVYGIEMARAHGAMQVTLLDLKEMVAEAQTHVEAAGLQDRISTCGLNMFEQEWPTGHDAHFFANIYHDWSEETNALLSQKSFAALKPGGRIFLHEILMDDDGTGPWQATSFSLMMLMGTLGKQYTLPELRALLEDAGFEDVRACRSGGGYYSLISARKPE